MGLCRYFCRGLEMKDRSGPSGGQPFRPITSDIVVYKE